MNSSRVRATTPFSPPRPSRVQYIDVAKGIGILLVVFGHSAPLHDGGVLYRIVFSFQVALFFLLSGVFFKASRSLGEVVTTRADALLKPYLLTQLVLSIDDLFLDRDREPVGYFVAMLSGSGDSIRWTPMWFLPHLFAVSVFAWFVCAATRLESRPAWVRALVVATMLSVGVATIKAFYRPIIDIRGTHILGLPWSVDVLLVSSAFFLAGFAFKKRILGLQWKPLPVALSFAVFALLHIVFRCTIDLNMRRYDSLFVCTTAAAAGIYMTLALSVLVARVPALARPLTYLGTATVFILIFHTYPQQKVTALVERRLPGHEALAAGVGFVAAIALSIAVYEFVRRVKPIGALYLPRRARAASTRRARVPTPRPA